MSQTLLIYIGSALVFIGAVIGYLVGHFSNAHDKTALKEANSKLAIILESEKQQRAQDLERYKIQKQQLSETFQALSAQVFRQNSESFLQLAKENLNQFHVKAQGEMDKKELAIEKRGEGKYREMIDNIKDPNRLLKTYDTILPAFMEDAIAKVKEQASLGLE